MSAADHDLMRLYDGELAPDDERAMERALAEDESAAERVRALGQLGEFVRLWADENSRGFDVSAEVMARLDAPVGQSPRTGAAATEARPVRSLSRLWPAAASIALAAAVLLLVVSRRPARHAPVPQAGVSLVPATQATPSLAVLPALAPEPSVAIESVDFGERQGAIFMVGTKSGETPVIWLADPPPDRHRIEPL